MVFNAIKEPNKYDPLSPKNIFAFGKLNNKKESTIIIWEKIIIAVLSFWLVKLIIKNIELIIKKWMANRPLKPSTKFAPFITNKKHSKTKQIWKILFSKQESKNSNPVLFTWIEKILIQVTKTISINNKRILGLILILKSSKNPKKNNDKVIVR